MTKCGYNGCKKRLNWVDVSKKCKCGKSFCINHWHITDHECTFDFKSEHKKYLSSILLKPCINF